MKPTQEIRKVGFLEPQLAPVLANIAVNKTNRPKFTFVLLCSNEIETECVCDQNQTFQETS